MRKLDRIVEVMSIIALVVMVTVIFLGVVFRYLLYSPLSWTEELARYMLIWITFLGTYLGFRRQVQIRMRVAFERFPPRWQRWSRLLGNVVMAIFFILLAWYGSLYARFFLGEPGESIAIPRGAVYIALPFTALLFLIHVVNETYSLWQAPREGGPVQ